MSKQLGINKPMDKLAIDYGLGYWSCVSPLSGLFWLRSDGLSIKLLDNSSPIIENLEWYDTNKPIGKDWQQPETEEEFLNRKLPCDIKIGSGINKAGTSIRTLLLRANNAIASQDIVIDKERQAYAKKLLLGLIKSDNRDDSVVESKGIDNSDPVGDLQYQCAQEKMNDLISSKQLTLIQKPFKYPCNGALYFTKTYKHQVKISGFFGYDNKIIIGNIDGISNNSFWCPETGEAVNPFGDTVISNDLIMFCWE